MFNSVILEFTKAPRFAMLNKPSTNWEKIPRTDKKAVPSKWVTVKTANVIKIQHGRIRSAVIQDAYFLLANGSDSFTRYGQKLRVAVECLWYGRKPRTSWMNITVTEGQYQLIENYTGEVVTNIERNDKHPASR